MPRRRSEIRVTDAERERVAERLRRAYADGALTHDELEARVAGAFAARMRGELSRLTRDLPRDAARAEAAGRAVFRAHATTYAAVNGGLVAMWLATGGPFWPAGSIAPWGAGLALHGLARRRISRARRR
ncbi:MAG: DUF1707 domain-containing protein [Thermoleophilaceae bacterium]